jgi:hypothetical protein
MHSLHLSSGISHSPISIGKPIAAWKMAVDNWHTPPPYPTTSPPILERLTTISPVSLYFPAEDFSDFQIQPTQLY